jgi:hypothetical protein
VSAIGGIVRFRVEDSDMKRFILTALTGLPLAGFASETVLTCDTKEPSEDVESVMIRFDEAAGTFELRGKAMWSVKADDDGAAKVKEVEFSADKITVQFKRKSALWLSLGAAIASNGRVGVLDRVTGTWTLGPNTFQCAPFESPVATPTSPICGRVKLLQLRQRDAGMVTRALRASQLSRRLL